MAWGFHASHASTDKGIPMADNIESSETHV